MKKIKKAVILAAGLGTRFLPITKGIPKGMINILDKPALHYIAQEIVKSQIFDIAIIVSNDDNSIKNYFSKNPALEDILEKKLKKLESSYQGRQTDKEISNIKNTLEDLCLFNKVNFTYIIQKNPKGSGDAVLCAEQFVNNEPFAILNGDDIIVSNVPCAKQLTDQYDNYNANLIGCQRVAINDIVKYSSVKYIEEKPKVFKIEEILEKPQINEAPSNLAALGRYVVRSEIFGYLKTQNPAKNGEIQFTDSLNRMAQDHLSYAYEFEGTRYDAGDKMGYLKATVDFAFSSNYKGEFKEYITKVLQEKF